MIRPVDQHYEQLRKAWARIHAIRKECKHAEYRVARYSNGDGHVPFITRVCTWCDAAVAGVTDEERAEVLAGESAVLAKSLTFPPVTMEPGAIDTSLLSEKRGTPACST